MDYPVVDVNGVPFQLGTDSTGYYVTATSQRVEATDSPVTVSFDPPIAPTVNLGIIGDAIKKLL